jgi:hypothetical protein
VIERHRVQIRTAFGFREFTRGDEDQLAGWLARRSVRSSCARNISERQLLVRCRAERVESPGRVDRMVASARVAFDQRFCERTLLRLDPDCIARLEDLFTDTSEKQVEAWRARAARAYSSDLRPSPTAVRVTLLAALCWVRFSEITDALVDLLIALALKVNTRADKRVERELTEDLRRVRGKEGILFRLTETALEHPDESVRSAVYPVVGETALRDLVKEAKANERAFQARVRTVLRGSYSNHYRRMLPSLLGALEFARLAHRPLASHPHPQVRPHLQPLCAGPLPRTP